MGASVFSDLWLLGRAQTGLGAAFLEPLTEHSPGLQRHLESHRPTDCQPLAQEARDHTAIRNAAVAALTYSRLVLGSTSLQRGSDPCRQWLHSLPY